MFDSQKDFMYALYLVTLCLLTTPDFPLWKFFVLRTWMGRWPVQVLHPCWLLHVGAPCSTFKTCPTLSGYGIWVNEYKLCLQRALHAVHLASNFLKFLDPLDASFWLHWFVILKHDWSVLWRRKGRIEYRTVLKALYLDTAGSQPLLCPLLLCPWTSCLILSKLKP